LVLEDRADPLVSDLSGTLFDAGWIRGVRDFKTEATDSGAGLAALWASVNGTDIGRVSGFCAATPGPGVSGILSPCQTWPTSTRLSNVAVDTAHAPFANGTNVVAVCAQDFAGNIGACQTRAVQVDNLPPAVSFANQQDPADPELVRVTAADPDSGLDANSAQIAYRRSGFAGWTPLPTKVIDGSIVAHVDSGAVAPGPYDFAVTVRDLAGNAAMTSARSDGEPMVLTFPLRDPVQLVGRLAPGTAQVATIGYGKDTKVRGRLLDGAGEPLADQEILVTEHFDSGALIDRRVRTVVTDETGRWTSVLPAGPSRTVDVSFAGTPRYRPAIVPTTALRVRSRASFSTSRERVPEGKSLSFVGKVGHFGARVPNGGKLVELQVRESKGRWNTVEQAFHTRPSGKFHLRYRFGRFYQRNARFVFRVKVAREQGWPYLAPVASAPKAVTVVAK
jgi:hypothetical protein